MFGAGEESVDKTLEQHDLVRFMRRSLPRLINDKIARVLQSGEAAQVRRVLKNIFPQLQLGPP